MNTHTSSEKYTFSFLLHFTIKFLNVAQEAKFISIFVTNSPVNKLQKVYDLYFTKYDVI